MKLRKKFIALAGMVASVLLASSILSGINRNGNNNLAMAAEISGVEPVVKYDFESVDGTNITNTGSSTLIGPAQIIGSGYVMSDSERGNVFYNYNMDEFWPSVRTNYLRLDNNIFTNAINGNAFSLTMWMKFDANKVDITDDWAYRWADIFVAYDSDARDKYPMVKLGVNLIGRVNNTNHDRSSYFDTADMGNYLADSKWHQIAFTISDSKTCLYVDGKEISRISFDGSAGRSVGDFFTNSKNLIDTICIGGNSLWNEDPDICAMFDDICIYDVELTEEQLSQQSGVIKNGVSFNDMTIASGKAMEYTINTELINSSNIKSYEWIVGDKQVSTSSTAYTPTDDDKEKIIKLRINMIDGSYTECSAYYSIFPVLYIEGDTGYGSVETEYVEVDFNLTGQGYTAEQLYNGKAEIRLRGNSTANLAKRPFKVKLDTKTDILGFGESKHWVLLADAIDVSLVRNKLLQSLAGDFGLDNMESELISLVYNGEYQGVYELSEHVRVGSTRVDIFEWEELAEDAAKAIAKSLRDSGEITEEEYDTVKSELEDELVQDYTWVDSTSHSFTSSYLKSLGKTSTFTMTDYLDFSTEVPKATGGVLLEMDFWYEIQEGKKPNIYTAYALPIYTNTPEDTTKFNTLVDYIDKYVQAMEYSLHSTDFVFDNNDTHYAVDDQGRYEMDFGGIWNVADLEGERVGVTYKEVNFENNEYHGWHYTDFLDIDSAINNMLICEVSLNWDSMKNSFFMYKDIDGKMVFGPVWDFDWAWGNSMGQDTNFPETWQTTNEWFANEQYYQTVQWNRLLIRDPYFIVKLYERYHEVRDGYIEPLVNTTLGQMADANRLAGLANDARWGTAFSATAGQNYTDQIDYVQTFLDRRLVWLDDQFASIDTLIESLGYYTISDDIVEGSVDTTSEVGYTFISAEVSNDDIKKVSFQVNGKSFYTADVKDGMATAKVPDSVLVSDGSLNVVQFRGMDEDGEYIINSDGTIKGNYTNAISNYTTFTKAVTADNEVTETVGVTIDGVNMADITIDSSKEDETDETVSKDETTGSETKEYLQPDSTVNDKKNQSEGMNIWLVLGIVVLVVGAGAAAVIIILKKNGIIGKKD